MGIIEKYRGRCGLCLTRPAAGVHEIIPRSAGGTLAEENQIPLCQECHNKVQANWRKYQPYLYQAQDRACKLFGTDIKKGGVT